MTDDARRYSPSVARNRDPILAVLRRHLLARGLVLEIASGSGEHIVHVAQNTGRQDTGDKGGRPGLVFQPSDPDADARASIDSWVTALGVPNIRPALALDASSDTWPIDRADVVMCINMIHIAPWTAAIGLIGGAARILPPAGRLYLYGPYRRDGAHTSPSNADFDRDLRSRNPAWGVRDLEAVVALADAHGFAPPMIDAMPANNLSLIFTRE